MWDYLDGEIDRAAHAHEGHRRHAPARQAADDLAALVPRRHRIRLPGRAAGGAR
ncbi:MAG: hypothetical protein MZW92_38005 [Comamonadaceae bacterium]|nr:hypothetical protein [Comamonadaceae bacterium]